MDYQNREGGKTGSGGLLSHAETNADRRERMRKLALETIDLDKDPYFMKNHLGSYECRLCLTLHTNEGSYLAHTQGRKHNSNLGRRAAREAKTQAFSFGGAAESAQASLALLKASSVVNAPAPKLKLEAVFGRPPHRLLTLTDPESNLPGIRAIFLFPQIETAVPGLPPPSDPDWPRRPFFRIVSTWEQRVERPDRRYQYLVVWAVGYQTVAIRVPADTPLQSFDAPDELHFSHWDPDNKLFMVQMMYKEQF